MVPWLVTARRSCRGLQPITCGLSKPATRCTPAPSARASQSEVCVDWLPVNLLVVVNEPVNASHLPSAENVGEDGFTP